MIQVLLVDDEPLVRQGLNMLLSTIGDLEVIGEAADGEEAIQKTTQLHPDLIVMDARMPGRDGISAIAGIKKLCPKALVIIITIEGGDELRQQAVTAGAFGFAEKESEQSALLQEIYRAIEFIRRPQS